MVQGALCPFKAERGAKRFSILIMKRVISGNLLWNKAVRLKVGQIFFFFFLCIKEKSHSFFFELKTNPIFFPIADSVFGSNL